ncbi:MAG: NAD-dependent epimerase/dehydratase family protein [Candidatus Anstonellaceae archaeon]
MKLAIFGASGRLGQEFCNYCLKKKLDFAAFVRTKEAQERLSLNCKSVLLTNEDEVKEQMQKVSHVINLTGSTNFRKSYSELYQANVQATKNILEICKSFSNIEKFIHISSIAVYPIREGEIVNESFQANPSSNYGKTKLAAEKEVLNFSKNFKIVILQPAIIYGPLFKEGFYKVLELIKKSKMPVIGNGKNHIPLVFYSDVLEAIYLSVKKNLSNPSKFILVHQPQLSQEELFKLSAKELGAKASFFHIPVFLAKFLSTLNLTNELNPEMVDQLTKDRLFDSSLAEKVLGWKPKVSFQEGIKAVVEEFFGNSGK